jgi:rhodanese-related sulfurtransferase
MSADAVRFLKEQGYAAQQLREGVADWDLVQAA